MTSLIEPALAMASAGFSVIPCEQNKKASIPWKEYQDRVMSEDEVKKHFRSAERLATVCGKVSGNLEILDFDDRTTWNPFLDLLEERRPGLAARLLKRQTPSGGYHLVYRSEKPIEGNQKLACTRRNEVRIETRGQGGYALAPPSPGYKIIEHGLLECPILSTEERNILLSTARVFDQREQTAETTQERNPGINSDRPGDRFNAAHRVSEILSAHGWKEGKRTTAGIGWTRPGKAEGTSGVELENGNFYVWSSNAHPLEAGKSYSPFALYAALDHGGDFSATARSIAFDNPQQCQKVEQTSVEADDQYEKPGKKVYPVGIVNFLQLEFPPRKNLLSPWLPSQGLAMIYASRGIGKTHLALGVAYAVASGGSFLGWQATSPSGVLYLDGEMPGVVMQERLGSIIMSNDLEPSAPFILLTPDLQSEGMPRIDTEEGQQAIESILTDDIKLIVVDNISTLAGAKENEADGWTPIQAWALRQRAAGRSVLFIHHSGKGGQQRGTSRREDVLDTVIALRRPIDYQPDQGAVFEIHYEKARGIYGDDVKSIEATLLTDEKGRMTWLTRTVEAGTFDRVVQLLNEGMKQTEIAVELGLHKSNVSRHVKRAMQEGLVEVEKTAKSTIKRHRMIRKEAYPGMDEIIDGGLER